MKNKVDLVGTQTETKTESHTAIQTDNVKAVASEVQTDPPPIAFPGIVI